MKAQPGAALNRDISSGERVEKDLDVLISRRDTQRRQSEGERAEEAAWQESARRHNARLEAEVGLAKLAWARHLRTVYAARMDEYEQLVQELEGTEPKGAS